MKNIPQKIYLQCCDEDGEPLAIGKITWCVDRINDTDIEYTISPAPNTGLHADVCRATGKEHRWVKAVDFGEVCGPCGTRR